MPVLVECLSVIVRNDAIHDRLPGGWFEFLSLVPNRTLATDGALARVGFMTPADVGVFVQALEGRGLRFVDESRSALDIAVVDFRTGPTTVCDWISVYSLSNPDGSFCVAASMRGHSSADVALPPGWTWERSLTRTATYHPLSDEGTKVQVLFRDDAGIDVCWDFEKQAECFIARTSDVPGCASPKDSPSQAGGYYTPIP